MAMPVDKIGELLLEGHPVHSGHQAEPFLHHRVLKITCYSESRRESYEGFKMTAGKSSATKIVSKEISN